MELLRFEAGGELPNGVDVTDTPAAGEMEEEEDVEESDEGDEDKKQLLNYSVSFQPEP